MPLGFFGLSAEAETLTIHPQMPSELSFWGIRNLLFHDVFFDLEMRHGELRIGNVRAAQAADLAALRVVVEQPLPEFGYALYVNGEQIADSVESGDTWQLTATLAAIAAAEADGPDADGAAEWTAHWVALDDNGDTRAVPLAWTVLLGAVAVLVAVYMLGRHLRRSARRR